MSFRFRSQIAALLLAASALFTAQGAMAQSSSVPGPSRLDLYGGYAYYHPFNSSFGGGSELGGIKYQPINPGAVASVSGYFNRWLGLQAEGGFHPSGPNDCVYTAQAGPVLRHQSGRFVPFVHALGGGAKVGGPAFQPCTWGWGVTGGLGFDYILSKHFALRPLQADYEHSQVNYGALVSPANVSGGNGVIDAYRLSAGIVIRCGDMMPPAPVQLACNVQPMSGFPGDPLTVTATATNLNPKHKTLYSWTTNGGVLSGSDATANINTVGVAPGTYAVNGHVMQGSKPYQQASCTASFTIQSPAPPTIICTANPVSVQSGETSIIASQAMSPQNRTLTYSYSATAGTVTGNTAMATLTTSGAAPGTITVTCNVVDDLGKPASSTTDVTVQAPPQLAAPQTQDLCSLSFDRDHKRPVRVDNEAKGCLDDIALQMQHDSTGRLVIVGDYAGDEKPAAGAERTLNVRQYLTTEKGIDASRIDLRVGTDSGRTVANVFVPAGATFADAGTTPVDMTMHSHGEAYGKPRQ